MEVFEISWEHAGEDYWVTGVYKYKAAKAAKGTDLDPPEDDTFEFTVSSIDLDLEELYEIDNDTFELVLESILQSESEIKGKILT